jgi:hypothetical protein
MAIVVLIACEGLYVGAVMGSNYPLPEDLEHRIGGASRAQPMHGSPGDVTVEHHAQEIVVTVRVRVEFVVTSE